MVQYDYENENLTYFKYYTNGNFTPAKGDVLVARTNNQNELTDKIKKINK